MNLTKCDNGHFYDSDTYASCPHCNEDAQSSDDHTVFYDRDDNREGKSQQTVVLGSDPDSGDLYDEGKTISIYQDEKVQTPQMSPTVGWLICTQGKFYGQDFRLKSGRNFIGRSYDMDVNLTGEYTVSRDRHATIIHEPRQNIFLAQPGESRELFYVNGKVVLSPVQLKKNDRIQIGDAQLMLIPCCDEVFRWDEED